MIGSNNDHYETEPNSLMKPMGQEGDEMHIAEVSFYNQEDREYFQ